MCPTNNTTQNNQPPEDSQCYTPIKLCLGRYKQADSLIRSSPKYFIKIISCFMVPTNSRHSPRIAHSPMTKCKSLQRTLQSLTKLIGQEWSRKLCIMLCWDILLPEPSLTAKGPVNNVIIVPNCSFGKEIVWDCKKASSTYSMVIWRKLHLRYKGI